MPDSVLNFIGFWFVAMGVFGIWLFLYHVIRHMIRIRRLVRSAGLSQL